MKHITKWAITLSLSTVVVVALAGYKTQEISSAIAMAESFPEHSEHVAVSQAQVVPYQANIEVIGNVVVPQHVSVRNELPGRITAVPVKPGESVKQDQVLVQLDISQELARVQSAKARLKLAQLEYKRLSSLRKSGSVSQSQFDTARAELDVVQAELTELDSLIRKKTIVAPFDGVLGLHQLAVGDYLETNSLVGEFIGNQPYLWIDFSVPQFYAPLPAGTMVTVASIGDQAEERQAEVIVQDTALASSTRSYHYRARLDARPATLGHNSAVQVVLPIGPEMSLVTVAATSVQFDQDSAFVYLLNNDISQDNIYRAVRQDVIVYQRHGDQILIESGLLGGETVAAAGAFKLLPGLLVYPSQLSSQIQPSGEQFQPMQY